MTVTLTIWHLINGSLIGLAIFVAGFTSGWKNGFKECKDINDRVRGSHNGEVGQ